MHILECASFGVSIFFVMSGFLMTYNYIDRPVMQKPDVLSAVKFGIRKIKRLYPLHLIMLIFPMGLQLIAARAGLHSINGQFILRSLSVVSLTHSLFPNEEYYFFLNLSSWYLSSIMFASMLFPAVLRGVRKCRSTGNALLAVFISFIIQFILCGIAGRTAPEKLMQWFTYICPLTRLFELSAGAYTAYIFINLRNKELSVVSASLLEAAAVAFCIAAQKVFYLGIVPDYWIRTALYFFPSVFIVFVSALGGGIFTKLLLNPVTKLISDMSAYIFVIHAVVINAVGIIMDRLPLSVPAAKVIYCITVPAVSLSLSLAYSKAYNYMKKRRAA